MSDYRRGIGHILAEGHDPKTCTACAYEAGRQDGIIEAVDELLERQKKNHEACAATTDADEGQ